MRKAWLLEPKSGTLIRKQRLSILTQTWFKLNPNSSIILNLFDHFSISSYHNSNSIPGHRDLMGKAKEYESAEN